MKYPIREERAADLKRRADEIIREAKILDARWKRKAREARLRNLIHWQSEDIKRFKRIIKDRTEARDWLAACYRELASKCDLEGSAFNASGTCGQDIEGS